MRTTANLCFTIGLLVLANGAVSFFFRYNFVTQERYGPSLGPVYIIGVAILILVAGLIARTIGDASKARTEEDEV